MNTVNHDVEYNLNNMDESKTTNEEQNTSTEKKCKRDIKNLLYMFENLCYNTGKLAKNYIRFMKCVLIGITKETRRTLSKAMGTSVKKVTLKVKNTCKDFSTEWKHAVQKTKDLFGLYKKKIRPAIKERGIKGAAVALKAVVAEGAKKNKRIMVKTLNLVAPALALFLFVGAVAIGFNLNFVLKVNYSDQEVGYIENEKTYEKAQSKLVDQIAFQEKKSNVVQKESFTLSVASKQEVKDADTLAEEIVSKSADTDGFKHAYGIYVDGKFVTACEDEETVEKELESMLQPYKEKKEYEEATVRFHQDVEVDGEAALYPPEYIKPTDEVGDVINGNKQEKSTYTVKEGDTLHTVAQKNNLSTDQLKKYNENLEEDSVNPGDKLVVSEQKKLLQVEVIKEIKYKEDINYEKEEIKNNEYEVGYEKVTKKGEKGEREITAQITYLDGQEYKKAITNKTVTKKPVTEQVTIGTKPKPVVTSDGGSGNATAVGGSAGAGDVVGTGGKLHWPCAGGYVSCGWYGYAGHRGMDIAAPHGTPIYAADDGVVITSGWSDGGYGYYVVIDHGNGMQTLYGHCSSLYVGAGAKVTRGQTIAGMGSTGNSTGNHVHFEVRFGGDNRVDPAGYL